MTRSLPGFALLAGLLAVPGLTACAPAGVTNQAAALFNHPASKTSDGTILSMRSVPVAAQPAGAMGGATTAMAARSSGGAGGSWSSMLPGALAGGLPGGLGSNSMGNLTGITGTPPAATPAPAVSATPASAASIHGQAMEFTLRMDDGSTQTVVLGDAQGLHAGDRVEVIRGDKTRLVHVS